jgi:deoxyribodipyrimidine photo-lyase
VPELGSLPADVIHEPWTARQELPADIYPTRVVDHATARDRALRAFRSLKQSA